MKQRERRNIYLGLAFLAPNILGVLVFTVFPVVFSLFMAFSNWDLKQHNMFLQQPIAFVGLDNVRELLADGRFVRFLGNTLFFMMGIPFAVAGSLFAAVLLSKDTRGGGGRPYLWLLASVGMVASCAMLAMGGMQATGMTVLFVGLATSILIAGVAGGKSVYRTLFYTPNFVSGVATFILWKKLFNTQNGPINNALQPVLDHVADGVNAAPGALISSLTWVFFAVFLLLFFMGTGYLRRTVADGDVGKGAALLPFVALCLPTVVAHRWQLSAPFAWMLLVGCLVCVTWQVLFYVRTPNRYACRAGGGFGSALILCLLLMVGQFVLLGLSQVAWNLPAMASDGLQAPRWLTDVNWAKPSLMGMGLWGALGSNNMLLYLAALTNVPGELYEAADIDGANRVQRFWHITWPQLAATTFFIFVMSTIGGLQGGFEMARVMTAGGPAGATTTLSYYIYMEGFETGRLGFASAVAWALFVLVFSVTLFNWKFGNRYAND